jgi:Family of unknown function (DUF6454)
MSTIRTALVCRRAPDAVYGRDGDHAGTAGRSFRLGGIELVDLADGRPIFQVPLLLWTAAGVAMTQNPVWLEETRTGLRGYFMPEDDTSTLYIYDVETK